MHREGLHLVCIEVSDGRQLGLLLIFIEVVTTYVVADPLVKEDELVHFIKELSLK